MDRAAVRAAVLSCGGLDAAVHLFVTRRVPGIPIVERFGSFMLFQGKAWGEGEEVILA